MSIYATLWSLKFPKDGEWADDDTEEDWIIVTAQAVPGHIRNTGPIWDFLPPPVDDDDKFRAVVFVTPETVKGSEKNGQEYIAPLLTITGERYRTIGFERLHNRLCQALSDRFDEGHRAKTTDDPV